MNLGLTGDLAVITGGTRGIGRAICRALAAEGCHLALCARDAGASSRRRPTSGHSGCGSTPARRDVTDDAAFQQFIASTVEEFGAISTTWSPTSAARSAATPSPRVPTNGSARSISTWATRSARCRPRCHTCPTTAAAASWSSPRSPGGSPARAPNTARPRRPRSSSPARSPRNWLPGGSGSTRSARDPSSSPEEVGNASSGSSLNGSRRSCATSFHGRGSARPKRSPTSRRFSSPPRAGWVNGAHIPVDGAQRDPSAPAARTASRDTGPAR